MPRIPNDPKLQAALAYLGTKFDTLAELLGLVVDKEPVHVEQIDLTETNKLLRALVEKEKEDIEITLDIV